MMMNERGLLLSSQITIPRKKHPNALFGCTEMISEIELSDNSKFNVERKWVTIQILLFGWLGI
jgi:hypothetical protein